MFQINTSIIFVINFSRYIIIDLYLIQWAIPVLLLIMILYLGFLTLVYLLLHISYNGFINLSSLAYEWKTITTFHIKFIRIIYTVIFFFNFITFIINSNRVLLIIINYLALNILFHTYKTGVDDSYTYLGIQMNKCLFFEDISCLLLHYIIKLRWFNASTKFILIWNKFLKYITWPFYYITSLLFIRDNDNIAFEIKNFRQRYLNLLGVIILILFLTLITFGILRCIIEIFLVWKGYNSYNLLKRWSFLHHPPDSLKLLLDPHVLFFPANKFYFTSLIFYHPQDIFCYTLTFNFYNLDYNSEFYTGSLIKPLSKFYVIKCVYLDSIDKFNLKQYKIPLTPISSLLVRYVLYRFFKKWFKDWYIYKDE